MYKLMIVEDEPVERQAIKLIIEMNCDEVEIVCECENGVEAVKSFKEHKPDLIILDINLPLMSGLEAIKSMHIENTRHKIIVVSSYNSFKYATQAIKLGVHDYILKPAKMPVLTESINSAIAALKHEVDVREYKSKLENRLNNIKPIIESDLIHSIISNKYDLDYQKTLDFMDIDIRSGVCFIINCGYTRQPLAKIIREHLLTIGMNCIGDRVSDMFVLFVFSSKELCKDRVEELISYCKTAVYQTVSGRLYIGAGDIFYNEEELPLAYSQAMHALYYAQSQNQEVALYCELNDIDIHFEIDIDELAQEISTAIIDNDTIKLKQKSNDFFERLLLLRPNDIGFCREKTYQLLLFILKVIDSRIGSKVTRDNRGVTLNLINALRDINAVRYFFFRELSELTMDINQIKNTQTKALLSNVLNYIDDNFEKNISLSSVAEEFKVSHFYLSKYIKKSTGKNFTDILTLKRIEAAQSLLRDETMSIKEVTYAVGFSSQNYFSKVFKKYCQVTPTDYKNTNSDHNV